MRALYLAFPLLLAGAATGAAETTPRGLYKVKGAPAVLPPTEIASFAAG
jgi:hypothetical protein